MCTQGQDLLKHAQDQEVRMGNKYSFDIVSTVDLQEVDNAVNQAKREMQQRYDFKGSKSSIDYNKQEKTITILADDDYKLKAIKDILSGRLIKRDISPRAISFAEGQKAHGDMMRLAGTINDGIPKDRAKEIVKIIKDMKNKAQAQIQDDAVRVISDKKDVLQEIIAHLKSLDFPIPLQFTNYR